ncbi:DMT family transporter [Amycolatopsis sp. NBC_00438]|uniref:DMT family transporter n=1 Tax=Amycolatopsis sp. NBC_00438 TaxID=2903558 RepID=UPI002E1B1649
MGAYLLLALAIAAEVSATVSLKLSEGFSKLGPSIIVVLGYAVAFVALVAIVGVVFLKEPVNAAMIAGLALVIGGVVLIEIGSAST